MERLILTLALFLIVCSCGSVKKLKTKWSYKRDLKEEVEHLRESMKLEVLEYGDTLTGTIPLRALGRMPMVVPVRSKGLELELTITDSTVSYKSIARPVARSSLSWEGEEQNSYKSLEEDDTGKEAVVERKAFSPPWWLIVVGVLVVAVIVLRLLNIISNPFKLLKR
ncbi:hypothetical protein [Cyclobacterium marinum]|uniref:Lipoprotein n=1 Tax=Cyclobacterium marinum (strain ATCC 25205 / DSM 745 / LMG 13164 / NCIMB 1802) TaxID=880070 RepID=G0IZ70_CYCMS|nr:hypothetical protein [Cyclobacterium marinum]AEL23849.1 hypothetical protein Cycma_0064 [Cyclobacterium marinum DSM 745]